MDRFRKRKFGFYILAGLCLLFSSFGLKYGSQFFGGAGNLSVVETEAEVQDEDKEIFANAISSQTGGTININSNQTTSANGLLFEGCYFTGSGYYWEFTGNSTVAATFRDCFFECGSNSIRSTGTSFLEFENCFFNSIGAVNARKVSMTDCVADGQAFGGNVLYSTPQDYQITNCYGVNSLDPYFESVDEDVAFSTQVSTQQTLM